MINRRVCIIVWILLLGATTANAQQDTTLLREVEVIKSYKPTITPNANKINTMPAVNDKQKHRRPNFSYNIQSNPVFSTFAVTPLKAATIQTQQKENHGYGLIRAGFGNYTKPYGELFFNTQQSKNTIFGIHARHLSSHSKIKLMSGDKVDAPYSDNDAQLYVKHLMGNKFILGSINFRHNGFNYYGYPADSIPQTFKESEFYNQHQTFTKGGINLQFGKATSLRDEFNWIIGAKYHYFVTKTEQNEHLGSVDFNISTPLISNVFQLNANINYVATDLNINTFSDDFNKNEDAWIEIAPAYLLGGKIFNAKLGAKLWAHDIDRSNPKVKFSPDVSINFMPIEDKLSLFAGANGNYQVNHYSKIAYQNFYVSELHKAKPTFDRLRFYGGFSGKLLPQLNFKLSADYSIIDDQMFFVNFDYVGVSESPFSLNRFSLYSDDLKQLKFNGELLFVSSDKLNIALEGNYYTYKLNKIEHAYHMPDWDLKLSVNYKITNRLDIGSNINLVGERKALVYTTNPLSSSTLTDNKNVYNLDPIVDINVSGHYKITPNFSIFAQLNNLAFQRYEKWLGYTQQGFNFMGGISYAF